MTNTIIQVATAGEALIDLIAQSDGQYKPCLGGAVYNLSRALARQGVGVAYLNPFSSDRFGRALAQQLVTDGVTLAQPEPVSQVTSLAVVSLNEAGQPDYAFYREGVADRQVCAEQLNGFCEPMAALKLVCTGALALDVRDATVYLPWLRHQKENGRLVVVDANLRPSVMPDLSAYRRHVLDMLHVADLIKVSDEDLMHLELLPLDADASMAVNTAENLLITSGAQLLALTLGAQGAWLLSKSGQRWYCREERKLDVVDTVGAGDSFLAGLLSALLQLQAQSHLSLAPEQIELSTEHGQSILAHAVGCASWVVQQPGCQPPTWQQTETWLTHTN